MRAHVKGRRPLRVSPLGPRRGDGSGSECAPTVMLSATSRHTSDRSPARRQSSQLRPHRTCEAHFRITGDTGLTSGSLPAHVTMLWGHRDSDTDAARAHTRLTSGSPRRGLTVEGSYAATCARTHWTVACSHGPVPVDGSLDWRPVTTTERPCSVGGADVHSTPTAWHGTARRGLAGRGWARPGEARPGRAGRGSARLGRAWHGPRSIEVRRRGVLQGASWRVRAPTRRSP